MGWKWADVAKYYIDVPMGASWGHILVMNLDRYNALPDDLKKIIDDMKEDYLKEFLRVYAKSIEDTRASWKASGKVEVITFPADEFLKATLGNAKLGRPGGQGRHAGGDRPQGGQGTDRVTLRRTKPGGSPRPVRPGRGEGRRAPTGKRRTS